MLNTPTWKDLSALAGNRLIKTSYIWLIVVPIVAHAFAAIENPVNLMFISPDLPINIGLPFSWKMFYFSALFVTLGEIIYAFYCPQLVKNFRDFSEFRGQGRGMEYLFSYARGPHSMPISEEHVRLLDQYENFIFHRDNKSIFSRTEFDNASSGLFWDLYNSENAISGHGRRLCVVFYFIGIVLAGYVFVQNVLFVMRSFVG